MRRRIIYYNLDLILAIGYRVRHLQGMQLRQWASTHQLMCCAACPTIHDRFRHPVKPKEWSLVPLQVIDEVVQRIRDGSITEVVYDRATASLISAPVGNQVSRDL